VGNKNCALFFRLTIKRDNLSYRTRSLYRVGNINCALYLRLMQAWKFTSSFLQDQITLHNRKQKLCIIFEIQIKERKFTSSLLQDQITRESGKQKLCIIFEILSYSRARSLYRVGNINCALYLRLNAGMEIYIFVFTGSDNFTQ
jgi:hypothetical protein